LITIRLLFFLFLNAVVIVSVMYVFGGVSVVFLLFLVCGSWV